MDKQIVSKPRRIYLRKGTFHALLKGKVYGTKDKSGISLKHQAQLELTTDGKCKVTQRVNHKKAVTEVWGQVKV